MSSCGIQGIVYNYLRVTLNFFKHAYIHLPVHTLSFGGYDYSGFVDGACFHLHTYRCCELINAMFIFVEICSNMLYSFNSKISIASIYGMYWFEECF